MKYTKLLSFLFLATALSFTVSGSVSGSAVRTEMGAQNPDGPIIDQFLAMLNGTEAAAQAAINKFGSPEVIANKMIPFGKNPKIIKTDGNCVRVSLQGEDEVNVYTLCEENGKITTFEWYFDEEE